MTKFYTNFMMKSNGNVAVRGYDNGSQFFEEYPCSPSLFVVDHGSVQSKYKSIEGQPLREKKFDNPHQAREFIKTYEGVESYPIFGFPSFEYMEISKRFPTSDYDPQAVRIFTIDIEVDTSVEVGGVLKSGGFPDPQVAKFPVNAISVVYGETCYAFGVGEFDPSSLTEDYGMTVVFYGFESEHELLCSFVEFWSTHCPDIVTGWNIEGFDIPYLVNRIGQVIGETSVRQLSPYGVVRSRTFTGKFGKEEVSYNISGIAILDYLQLYLKHTFVTRSSYKLDNIAFVELGERKIDYEGNLFTLYRENPQLFFEYNCKDSILVNRLEKKIGLISLVMSISYFAKINYQDTFSPVKTWDVIISNRLYDEGIVVPNSIPRRTASQYEGAYVKEPKPGRFGWGFSVDKNSMYPLNIRSFNIGPDTYVRTSDLTPELINLRQRVIVSGVDSLVSREIDTSILKKYNYSMTANGEFYRRDFEGILSRLVKELYEGRTADKKASLKAKAEYESLKDDMNVDRGTLRALMSIVNLKGTSEKAKKVLLNSLYGALANEYFRFYRTKDAEAITISGQLGIKYLGKRISDYICSVTKEQEDKCIYSDTDSCYFDIQSLVDKVSDKVPSSKMVDFLDEFIEKKIQPEINKTLDDLCEYLNAYQNAMGAKREAIFSSAIWTGKKRYALHVWDLEGVRYHEPKVKVTGIETQKSSTPEPVRDALMDSLGILLSGTELELREYVSEFREKFSDIPIEDIAFPRSVNGIEKYQTESGAPGKGCPIHVKAAITFNNFVAKRYPDLHQPISSGDKLKYIHLKEPNPFGSPVFGFSDNPPREVDIRPYVDFDMQFEKSFLSPLEILVKSVAWSLEDKSSLDDFFF